MVAKVVPMGTQVHPQRHPGAIKVLTTTAGKSDARTRPITDASKTLHIAKMYSFLAGDTCNPPTPVQSKPTFYISGLEAKKTAT